MPVLQAYSVSSTHSVMTVAARESFSSGRKKWVVLSSRFDFGLECDNLAIWKAFKLQIKIDKFRHWIVRKTLGKIGKERFAPQLAAKNEFPFN